MQQVFQLADVTGQRVGGDGVQCAVGELGHRHAGLVGNAGEQCCTQCGQILPALAQWRDDDLDHIEPVIQILAEPAGLDIGRQVAVGGADDAHVHGFFLGGAQRPHAALLDGAQQLGLHRQRQVTDFVEEQGAPACGLEVAVAVLRSPGVGALAGTKEFGFQQVFRDGSAVHGDQGAIRALAAGVQGLGHQLLAGARLAMDQHGRHAARYFGHALLDVADGVGLAHQAIQGGVGTAEFAGRCRCIGRAAGAVAACRTRRGDSAGALDGRGHHRAELLEVHGLGEVVEGPGAQRLDRVFCRAVSGHDHAALPALLVAQVLQQLHAEPVGQPHVGDHRVKALGLELLAGLLHVGRGLDPVALTQQGELVQGAQIGFVVNDKDGGGRGVHGGGSQTTMVSNKVALSAGRVVRRKPTVKALPPMSPRAVGRFRRW